MSFGLDAADPAVCSSHGTCSGPDQCVCSHSYSGTQCEEPPAPTLEFPGAYTIREGELLEFRLVATYPDPAVPITYSMSQLMRGATLNASTGAFSWVAPPGSAAIDDESFTATANGKSVTRMGAIELRWPRAARAITAPGTAEPVPVPEKVVARPAAPPPSHWRQVCSSSEAFDVD